MKLDIKKIDGLQLKKCFQQAAAILEKSKEEINELNVFPVPDGDTGTNMSLTLQSALKNINTVKDDSVTAISKAASMGALMGARGNSGVILSQLLRGFAQVMKGLEFINVEAFANALDNASKSAYKAVMKPTEGTILTVSRMIAEEAVLVAKKEQDFNVFFQAILLEGRRSLELTPTLLPALKEANVVDAGGKGYLLILEGFYRALFDDEKLLETEDSSSASVSVALEEKYAYQVDYVVSMLKGDEASLKQALKTFGNVETQQEGIDLFKLFVKTDHPGMLIEKTMQFGDIDNVRIDRIVKRHEKPDKTSKEIAKKSPEKEVAFIAVSAGEGINRIFNDLHVDHIISGGQTMNPSTEDFLKAMEYTNAKQVFILPNNKNIILAAEQAKKMSENNVHVIKTKSIPQGFSALLAYNPHLSAEENVEAMSEMIHDVKTLQVTYAVRDSKMNGLKIKKDQMIGIYDGDIVVTSNDAKNTAVKLVEHCIDKDDSLITIFYGADVSESESEALYEALSSKYGDCDVELVRGGQPIYDYLISIE